jgi:hypothetical protein
MIVLWLDDCSMARWLFHQCSPVNALVTVGYGNGDMPSPGIADAFEIDGLQVLHVVCIVKAV